MWNLAIPWWEFIVRALLVYAFLVVLLRITAFKNLYTSIAIQEGIILVMKTTKHSSIIR